MTWFLNDKEFTSEDIQDNVGFVYLITNLVNDKKYIGKKLFTKAAIRRVKGRKKKYRKESNWCDYYGSCEPLLEDVRLLGKEKFRRDILYLCETKRDMTFYEVREQFFRRVLEIPGYYNTNILGRFFVRDKTKELVFHKNIIDITTNENRCKKKRKKERQELYYLL